jgi:enamine deaminase RidA (YjgF/YER057c/UK114 family)
VNNCLDTIESCLNSAGFEFRDIIRATYILADVRNADLLFSLVRCRFVNVRPTIQLFEARLYDSEMQLSIDVIACHSSSNPD